jgi:hypothetical protein
MGALTLDFVRNGLPALDDLISRRLPEAAKPRVLIGPDPPIEQAVEYRDRRVGRSAP